MNENYAFVMMIKEKWWQEFLRLHHGGKKIQSYVQRGQAPPKNTSLIIFYVTRPVAKIGGYAEFVERKVGSAEEMWKMHGDESVLSSAEQYFDFVSGKKHVSFVRFKNLQEAANPVSLNNALPLLGVSRLSRKGFYVDKETADSLIELMT